MYYKVIFCEYFFWYLLVCLFVAFEKDKKSVLVKGFVGNVDTEYLEMYFENEERSGGGAIENISVNPTLLQALITFAEASGKCFV